MIYTDYNLLALAVSILRAKYLYLLSTTIYLSPLAVLRLQRDSDQLRPRDRGHRRPLHPQGGAALSITYRHRAVR